MNSYGKLTGRSTQRSLPIHGGQNVQPAGAGCIRAADRMLVPRAPRLAKRPEPKQQTNNPQERQKAIKSVSQTKGRKTIPGPAQKQSKIAENNPKMVKNNPKIVKNNTKMTIAPPSAALGGASRPQYCHFAIVLVDFGIVFNDFGIVFDYFLIVFGPARGLFLALWSGTPI